MFGKAAEATALNQAGDPNRGTAAALNVRSGVGGDGIVRLHPNCSGAYSDRPLRSMTRFATLRNEVVLEGGIVHVARPNQERIWRVRCALITVPTTFHHETQIVLAGEVHGGSDIFGIPSGDSINMGFGGPGIDPTQGLS